MIVPSDSKDDTPLIDLGSPSSSSSAVAGPSTLPTTTDAAPLISGKDAEANRELESLPTVLEGIDFPVPAGGEEPPPEFTPYEAEYFATSNGDIVSHDTHLNEDGEALYRFLLSMSQNNPPGFFLYAHGSHTEHRTRMVQRRDNNGNWRTQRETYTETITDFDFHINISQYLVSGPVHWTVADEEPAFRGQMYKEVDGVFEPSSSDIEVGRDFKPRRKATSEETKNAKAWRKERKARGLPPWVGPGMSLERWNVVGPEVDPSQTSVLKSSKTLRQWADEYCASKKHLKEFTYDRYVYGWNLAALEEAVTAAIRSTYYTGSFEVRFVRTNKYIHIRPDNRLSRTLSNKWLKVLFWVLLIYPFIWLYKRFSGGGKWQVCGGAYALKRWQPVMPEPDTLIQGSEPLPPYSTNNAMDGRIAPTAGGPTRLIGLKEGEWFQMWEGTIKRAVSRRLQTDVPLMRPDDAPTPGVILDGYRAVL